MKLRGLIVRGLLFVVPIWLTVTVVGFVYSLSESWLGALTDQAVRLILPASWLTGPLADGHIPGLSLGVALVLLTGVGLVASWPMGAQGLRLVDHVFLAIPGVRSLYSACRKIIDAVGDPAQSRFKKVVLFKWAGVKTLGFLTGTTEQDGRQHVFIFVPHMPNPTSGFLVLVPADEVTDTGLTPEEGIKLGMSLGVLTPPKLPVK